MSLYYWESDAFSWSEWGSMFCLRYPMADTGGPRVSRCSYVLLTSIAWVRWCSPSFPTIELLFFPLWLINILEKMPWYYTNVLLLFKSLSTSSTPVALACNSDHCGVLMAISTSLNPSTCIDLNSQDLLCDSRKKFVSSPCRILPGLMLWSLNSTL